MSCLSTALSASNTRTRSVSLATRSSFGVVLVLGVVVQRFEPACSECEHHKLHSQSLDGLRSALEAALQIMRLPLLEDRDVPAYYGNVVLHVGEPDGDREFVRPRMPRHGITGLVGLIEELEWVSDWARRL